MKSTLTLMLLSVLFGFQLNAQSCNANFTSTPDSMGNVIQFTNLSTGNFTNVTWSFGDGTASNQINPVHTFNMNTINVVC